MIWIILGVIIALILAYACANTFYEIACMKEHNDRKYFWWTFFVPLMGALMVVALPDRKNPDSRKSAMKSLWKGEEQRATEKTGEFVALNTDLDSSHKNTHTWRCSGCGQMINTAPCPHCGQR